MIKGINKQILEVTNTESPYFEKIIFFVRPSSASASEKELKDEAQKIALKAQKPPREKKSFKQLAKSTLYVFMIAGAGVAISFIISGFIK